MLQTKRRHQPIGSISVSLVIAYRNTSAVHIGNSSTFPKTKEF